MFTFGSTAIALSLLPLWSGARRGTGGSGRTGPAGRTRGTGGASTCAETAETSPSAKHTNTIDIVNCEVPVSIYLITAAWRYCMLAMSSSRSAIDVRRSILFWYEE